MKLYEAHFTFTPDDETSGEGAITISAASEQEATTALLEILEGVTDLQIKEVRELTAIPEAALHPTEDRPTLQ